jgi:hypothetical protein
MDSKNNEKIVGIYWDLNTCDSNTIELMAHKIRELFVKTNKEKEFFCTSNKSIPNLKELEDKHYIRIIYCNHLNNLKNFLKTKILDFVNENVISMKKSIVILITGDYYLAKVLLSIRSSAQIVLIYGQQLNRSLINIEINSLSFNDLKSMVNNMGHVFSLSETELELEEEFNSTFDNSKRTKGFIF